MAVSLLDNQQSSGPSPEDAMRRISEGIAETIHGPARERILQTFEQDPSPKAAAGVLYKPARQAIGQAEQAGVEVEEEFIFSVVADGIDMLAEILEAMGQLEDSEQALNEFRQATLMEVLMLHAEQVGDDPDQRQAAQQALAMYAEDGTLDQVIGTVEKQAKGAGLDPEQLRAEGQQMAMPKRDPVAEGVEQGLM
jgi:hypothetical protein